MNELKFIFSQTASNILLKPFYLHYTVVKTSLWIEKLNSSIIILERLTLSTLDIFHAVHISIWSEFEKKKRAANPDS